MSVGIYIDNNVSSKVSTDSAQTNPVVFRFTNAGGVEERQLFLRHEILAGAGAESSNDVIVDPVDIALGGGDQSTWLQIAADVSGAAGTYSAAGVAKNLGNVNVGAVVPFWVKATVPVNTETGAREDLALNLSASSSDIPKTIDLSAGTYTSNAIFDGANNRIKYSSAFVRSPEPRASSISLGVGTGTNGTEMIFSGMDLLVPAVAGDTINLVVSANWSINHNGTSKSSIVRLRRGAPNTGTLLASQTDSSYATDSTAGLEKSGSWSVVDTVSSGDISGGVVRYVLTGACESGGTMYGANRAMDIEYASSDSTFLSGWIDVSLASTIREATYTQTGTGSPIISYRTADNSSGSGATAWFNDPADLNLAKDWLQIRIQFYGINTTYISNLKAIYSGSFSSNFDTRFYNGPSTPELISPANGSSTEEFNPELSAVTISGDYIQFQLDNTAAFNSTYLSTWEVLVTDGVPVATSSPLVDRPAGVWYWRARSKLDGIYGSWTDYWIFTIQALVTNNAYLYINLNQGIESADPLTIPKHLYVNVNLGLDEDLILRNRHIYLNVLIESGAGEVIYPLYDKTDTRKTDFTGDGFTE